MSVCTESGQPICGNGLVEAGEDCDCGYSDQCKDPCCYNANEGEGKKCKLQPGKICRSDAIKMPFFVELLFSTKRCHQSGLLLDLTTLWFVFFTIQQSQPRPMLHIRVHVQGHEWEVQTGVRMCQRRHVQRSYRSVSCFRTKAELHLLPFRNTSLPQWGMLRFSVLLLFPV